MENIITQYVAVFSVRVFFIVALFYFPIFFAIKLLIRFTFSSLCSPCKVHTATGFERRTQLQTEPYKSSIYLSITVEI